MAIDLGKLVSKVFTAGVEGGMTAARVAGQAAKGAARLYNSLAEHLPVPLPRIPDGTSYERPNEVYQPPPPPPRPAAKKPPAPEPPRPTVKPAAPKASGIAVEKGGPSEAEYKKQRAEKAEPKKAEPKKAAPKKAKPKKAEPKKDATPTAASLDKLRKAELQKMLDDAGKKYPAKATKKDLIALIRGE